ncbi:MAG: hypothetical protein KC657_00190 [Myxococcales bacterium]|nr:hypothetical protein [Myxococcales bacterium]
MLHRNDTEACLRILLAVALADGTVTSDEERALGILAGVHDLPKADASLIVDIPKEAARISSPEARRATYDAAIAMSEIDGHCTAEEHALLVTIGKALGFDDPPGLTVREHAWHEDLDEPRARLASVESKFLHEMARADTMSNAAYAARVEELRAEREAILREALGAAIVQ